MWGPPTGKTTWKDRMACPMNDRDNDRDPGESPAGAAPGKALSLAARCALEEAAARRAAIDARAAEVARVRERQGRGGLEPVRYEDWEVKGLASDF